jgi:hypothetical protein
MQSVQKVTIRARGGPQVTEVEITRACGHAEFVEVRGDPTRSAYLDNARLRLCKTCYREAQTQRDTAAVNEGRRCALDGSERQISWAQGIRQRRAVEFGQALNDAKAWAQAHIESGVFSNEFVRDRIRTAQTALALVFAGKVTWLFVDAGGHEFTSKSDQARWWIDTRELLAREVIAWVCPQYRWESYGHQWEPLFRDEVLPEAPIEEAPSEDDDEDAWT